MSTEALYKNFHRAELAYQDKFGEPPHFPGWDRINTENLQAIDKAIRTNTPLNYEDPSNGGKRLILT
jgi:hypothetical protein